MDSVEFYVYTCVAVTHICLPPFYKNTLFSLLLCGLAFSVNSSSWKLSETLSSVTTVLSDVFNQPTIHGHFQPFVIINGEAAEYPSP